MSVGAPRGRNTVFPPSIHPFSRPLPPALKTSHHRNQLPSLFLFYFSPLFFPLLLMKSSQSLSQLCVCVGESRPERGEAEGGFFFFEKKRDSMCLSEWRWRVSVWLVNPV